MAYHRSTGGFAIVLTLFAGIAAIIPVASTTMGAESGQARTVPGPESDKLVPAASGFVVFERAHGGGISAVELPSLRETTVIPDPPADAADRPTITGDSEQGQGIRPNCVALRDLAPDCWVK
jgi:hypothetical protein